MPINKRDGVDIPTDEGINNFDDTPYFDYHHLKAIENVSKSFFFFFFFYLIKNIILICFLTINNSMTASTFVKAFPCHQQQIISLK
jgi:quinol-cytochrome oxidoreductase complex cytochrome b subunit